MNPILNAVQMNQMQALMNVWKMAQSMANPEQFLISELTKSEKYGEIFKLLQSNNGNFEKTFYDYAKQQGGSENVETFLNSLKQSMNMK